MTGNYDPNFDPLSLVLITLLHPVVIGVAFYLGRRADQWQKLLIAGFVAALAGAIANWLLTFAGLWAPRPLGSDAGVFLLSLIYGTAISAVGYWTRRRQAA